MFDSQVSMEAKLCKIRLFLQNYANYIYPKINEEKIFFFLFGNDKDTQVQHMLTLVQRAN